MPKKSSAKPPEIERLLARVKYAERLRQDADNRYGYSRSIMEYQGEYASVIPTWLSGIQMVPINEVYAYVKTFVPTVYSRDPYIAVNPKGQSWIVGSKILELAVNAYWRDLRLKKQVRRCIHDAILAEGWIKVGYSSSLGSIETEAGEQSLQPSEYVKSEEIFALRVSWKNMVRDPDATDGIHDARWVAQQIIVPLEAVKNSSLYENTKDLRPNYVVEMASSDRRLGPSYKDEQEYVELWEIWDRDAERVYTISEGANAFLMNKKWPYKFDGFPFVLLRFNENNDEAYAPNLISPWEPQLWEKIKLRAMMLDHIKRFGRQLAAEKGSLSRAEVDKFQKGISGSIIFHEQGKQPPNPIPYPQIQTDMYAVENRIDLDKDNISGQPNAVRSAPQRTQSRTLGEIDRLISAFQSRQNDPQGIVEDFSSEVAYKLIGLMQQYLPARRFVRATQLDMGEIVQGFTDEAGNPRFDGTGFTFSKKEIQDVEFDIEVRAGSTLPLDKQNRIESMVSIAKLGPTIGVTPGDELSRVLGKNLIAEFDMPEITAAYERVLKKFRAMEQTAKAAAFAKNQMTQEKIADLKATVLSDGAVVAPGPV